MKKIKGINPLVLVMGAINDPSIIDEIRKDVFRNEIKDVVIDTVCGFDTGLWETGIEIDGVWIIVEQYEDRKKAKIGHNKYVKQVKKGKKNFKDIKLYGDI